jgi:hypothetical protein
VLNTLSSALFVNFVHEWYASTLDGAHEDYANSRENENKGKAERGPSTLNSRMIRVTPFSLLFFINFLSSFLTIMPRPAIYQTWAEKKAALAKQKREARAKKKKQEAQKREEDALLRTHPNQLAPLARDEERERFLSELRNGAIRPFDVAGSPYRLRQHEINGGLDEGTTFPFFLTLS